MKKLFVGKTLDGKPVRLKTVSTLWKSLCVIFGLAWLATLVSLKAVTAEAENSRFDAAGICAGDRDHNGEVTVDEIVAGVQNLLSGCDYIPVQIRFAGVVGERPFRCGQSYTGVGLSSREFVPADFRFYVSNLRLLSKDDREVPLLLEQDGVWQFEEVALIDFEDKNPPCDNGTVQVNDVVRARVAPGEYNGIRFVLGVPFRWNHGDASVAPPPLNLTALFWSWQAGYKFLRVDTALERFSVHLGSTGCYNGGASVVEGCTRPNRAEIILRPFDPEWDIIVADLAGLLSNVDWTQNQPDTAPGCMSGPDDQDCAPIMPNLGVDFASGLPAPASQKLFRVATR